MEEIVIISDNLKFSKVKNRIEEDDSSNDDTILLYQNGVIGFLLFSLFLAKCTRINDAIIDLVADEKLQIVLE